MKLNKFNKKYIIIIMMLLMVVTIGYINIFSLFPGELTIFEGDEYVCDFVNPFLISIKADKDGIINIVKNQVEASNIFANLSSPVALKSKSQGKVNLNLKLFGLIPIRTMKVEILQNKKVVPCGNTVGVKLRVNGILVIGISDVETFDGRKIIPAKDIGIKTGDLIIEVNNKKINKIDELIKEVENSKGNSINLKYKRGEFIDGAEIIPVKSADDKKYHLGLWVRDSTAGIGTLTFYDPETEGFGALGHGITDIDTGALMPVENGEILKSSILGIRKGVQGKPGELKGVFLDDQKVIGSIKKNCSGGIYGELNDQAGSILPDKPYPIALRSQVKVGPAKILSNINGNDIREYSIEIQKVSKQSLNGPKGMIIKITDPYLLQETGGIVQGMSGSPIIQNGKLIGAVTHVLVNDPTRGYGIFIEWMLKNMEVTNIKSEQKSAS